MDKKFRKNTIWNMLGTGINAFNSLFLMIIVTRINGVSLAGIFTFAFSTATLFNIIGVYAGRVYQVTDKGTFNDKEYFMNRVISCLIMVIISIGFVLIKQYNFTKTVIVILLCFLKMLEAFADVLYAFFQKDDDLYKVGISLTLKTLLGLILFFIVDLLSKNLILSILMFVIVYLLVMYLYDFRQLDLKKKLSLDWKIKNSLNIFIKGFSVFCVSFLTIYLINSSKYAIDSYVNDDIQAIFGIIIMPATIMILIAQFLIHPFLNMINNEIKDNNYKKLIGLVTKICLFLFGVGILIIVACHFLGIYILEFIYGLSLREYATCLSIILLGAVFYALTSVINTVLIAMRYTFIQMVVYALLSCCALFLSNYLVMNYEIMGATLNYFIIMFINFIIFLFIFIIILKKETKKLV